MCLFSYLCVLFDIFMQCGGDAGRKCTGKSGDSRPLTLSRKDRPSLVDAKIN